MLDMDVTSVHLIEGVPHQEISWRGRKLQNRRTSNLQLSHPARGWPWPCFRPSYSNRFIPFLSLPVATVCAIGPDLKSESCGRYSEFS